MACKIHVSEKWGLYYTCIIHVYTIQLYYTTGAEALLLVARSGSAGTPRAGRLSFSRNLVLARVFLALSTTVLVYA